MSHRSRDGYCRPEVVLPFPAPRAGDRSPRRSGAISMVGEDIRPQSLRTGPLMAGRQDASNRFVEQSFCRRSAAGCYFAWGCLRYFGSAPPKGSSPTSPGRGSLPLGSANFHVTLLIFEASSVVFATSPAGGCQFCFRTVAGSLVSPIVPGLPRAYSAANDCGSLSKARDPTLHELECFRGSLLLRNANGIACDVRPRHSIDVGPRLPLTRASPPAASRLRDWRGAPAAGSVSSHQAWKYETRDRACANGPLHLAPAPFARQAHGMRR